MVSAGPDVMKAWRCAVVPSRLRREPSESASGFGGATRCPLLIDPALRA